MTEQKHDEKAHEPAHTSAKPAAHKPNEDADVEPKLAIASLLPTSAKVGDPDFALRVVGSLFDRTCVVVVGGKERKTTFVTDTELTTIMDMAKWVDPDPKIPVLVKSGDKETETLTFALNPKS